MISEQIHIVYQVLVNNDPSLFVAIRAFLGAHVDPPLVVDRCCEDISINDLLWDNFEGNAHEFRVW